MLYVSPVAKPPFATKIFKVKRLHHKTLRALTSPHSISSLWQETQVALDEISPSQTSMVTAMNAAPKSETPRIAKLLPFLCSHELAAKAASHLRRRLASSRQSGLWKQQSDHEPNQLVSHVVSHVSQASFLSESHQMETWHLKSPYFSSDTDSSPSFQVQSQGYTYTTCAECILDVAQKTARLQVWLWFCVTHGHSEFGQFAHFARQGIKHQRHQVLLLRDTPTCGAALTSTMFHQSGALLTKLVSEQICLAFLGPDFKIAKLAATLLQRGAIEAASKRAAKKPWRLARNACFGAPTCLVWSLRFPCGFAVSMGKLQNILLFGRFQL